MIFRKMIKNNKIPWNRLFMRSHFIFVGLIAMGLISFIVWLQKEHGVISVILKQIFQ